MKPVTRAVIAAGLVSPESIAEFQRWGMLPRELEVDLAETKSEALEDLQDALEEDNQAILQKTDLDVLYVYLDEEQRLAGRLVLNNQDTGRKTTKAITYALLPGKRVIIPYSSEYNLDLVCNAYSHLVTVDEKKQYFRCGYELFVGDVKAFLVLEEDDVE